MNVTGWMNLLSFAAVEILDLKNISNLIEFIFTLTVLLVVCLMTSFFLKRKFVIIYNVIVYSFLVVSFLFQTHFITYLIISCLLAGNLIFCLVNSGYLRKYVAKPSIHEKIKKVNSNTETDFNTFVNNMVTTVEWLSKNKVGALITIERKNSLSDFIKSGTTLNATFTPELVESIFYEGTRLHDGALVIQDTRIIAAAVYYPPSNNTFVGKFGARHRAAIGISEITDSITIIVSEETGRIAIAHLGVMDNIPLNEFRNIFINQLQNN